MIANWTSDYGVFLRFLRPYRWRLLRILLLTAAVSILVMFPPLLTRAFIDRVVSLGERDLFLPLAVGMLALPLLISLANFVQNQGIAYVTQRFVCDLRVALYSHVLKMSPRFFGKNSTGLLVNRLMGDTGNVADMLSYQAIMTVSDLVCSVFAVVATFALNWRLALLIVAVISVFLVNYRLSIAAIRTFSRRYWRAFDRLSGGVQNRLAASLTVKSFGAEPREQTAFERQSAASIDLQWQAAYSGAIFWQKTALIQNIGRAVLYFLGCALVLRGEMSYGDVLAFTTYAMQLLGPAVRFSQLARRLQDVRIAAERILEIVNEKQEVADAPRAAAVGRLRGAVEFNHVDFDYDPASPVIRDFNLQVRPGETVALVGPTGCGKTTLMLLLMRFIDVGAGSLKLDGTEIREIGLKSLRAQFGIVLQDPLLFDVSVADNIRYARPRATPAEIEAAARAAEIHEFILTLPRQYQTVLGSEGLQLSVGQKQRLTIARAVLADSAILIMDEATSALDSESERAIQLALRHILRRRTAFIVAHRLSTIRNASRIVLMKKGRIVEMGAHAELMDRPGGLYRALYRQHLRTGIIEDEKLEEA